MDGVNGGTRKEEYGVGNGKGTESPCVHVECIIHVLVHMFPSISFMLAQLKLRVVCTACTPSDTHLRT
jgi:hypothetical protein